MLAVTKGYVSGRRFLEACLRAERACGRKLLARISPDAQPPIGGCAFVCLSQSSHRQSARCHPLWTGCATTTGLSLKKYEGFDQPGGTVTRMSSDYECATSEEQKPSQRRGRELQDQQLLAWMEENFDVGFGKVVEAYWRELSSWAYKILQGSGFTYLSEDAVQEGLLSAYKDLFHHRQKLSNLHLHHWLYAIVRQKAIECLEQGTKTGHLAGLLGWENEGEDIAASRSTDDDPGSRLERRETIREAQRTVTELLKSLSDTQREVIVLKYFAQDGTEPEEITSQQIAQRLDKPVGTVRSDISRAIQRMRKRLMEQRDKSLSLFDRAIRKETRR